MVCGLAAGSGECAFADDLPGGWASSASADARAASACSFARASPRSNGGCDGDGIDFDGGRGHRYVRFSFAGATADAFTLFERLEAKLERHPGQLLRAAIELAKDWRTDRYLRRLEAMLIVADADRSFTLTGNGDVLEPSDGIVAIGSGGNYALAAARALMTVPEIVADEVARRAMQIAADICIYTNENLIVETI